MLNIRNFICLFLQVSEILIKKHLLNIPLRNTFGTCLYNIKYCYLILGYSVYKPSLLSLRQNSADAAIANNQYENYIVYLYAPTVKKGLGQQQILIKLIILVKNFLCFMNYRRKSYKICILLRLKPYMCVDFT